MYAYVRCSHAVKMDQELERLTTLLTSQMEMAQQHEAQQRVRDEAYQPEMRNLLLGLTGASPSTAHEMVNRCKKTKLHDSVVTPPYLTWPASRREFERWLAVQI